MLIDPADLINDLDRLEEIEKASLRLVVQAIYDFRREAVRIFSAERDLVQDIGEDITREALDRMGVSRIDTRLFGKMDYKRARYVFHPQYALRQALFIDSKAEKDSERRVARIQIAQTSMRIRQIKDNEYVDEAGTIPVVLEIESKRYLSTTIFVKYNYAETAAGYNLTDVTVAALPNGMLQDRYNPNAQDNIWNVGPHSTQRGEAFRTRLAFNKLKAKQLWRVQDVPLDDAVMEWDE